MLSKEEAAASDPPATHLAFTVQLSWSEPAEPWQIGRFLWPGTDSSYESVSTESNHVMTKVE